MKIVAGECGDVFDSKRTIGIWWLASYPKSGNTWVRHVINAAVTGFPPNINAAFQYVCGDHGIPLFQHTAAIPVDKMGMRDFLCYRLAALRNHLAVFGLRDAALKTHHANLNVFDVPLIPAFLSKGAVYIVRDPRDVVISFSKHLGLTIDETIVSINTYESEINGGGASDLTLDTPSIGSDSQSVEIWISGGTDGVQYRVECVVTTSTGAILEADGILSVKDT